MKTRISIFTIRLGAVAMAGTLWAFPARAGSGTWADWMAPSGDAPLTVEFQPGWVVEAVRKPSPSAADTIEPNRGYDGELVLTLAPGAEAPSGPLTVHLMHSVAYPEDINWPEGRIPDDFVPMVRPQAVPRRPVAEAWLDVPAEFPLRIPVVRPRSSAAPHSWRRPFPSALFGRYEVRDSAGRLLCRGILPARKPAETTRSLVGRAEDDEVLKQMSGRGGTFERLDRLPDPLEAYRQIRAIWFTEALWSTMDGREDLARRLLLSGVRITGETALVQRIQSVLGTGRDGLAVAEYAAPSSWGAPSDFNLRNLGLATRTRESRSGRRFAGFESSLLDNEANLFAPVRRSYLRWTLAGLLGFALGAAVLLVGVFHRRKGERRVAIWWALPIWTIGCAAAIWGGGLLLLDRRPRVDVTEYRLAMATWPEMHCRAVASALTFAPGRPVWRLPAEAVVAARHRERLDGWWARLDSWASGQDLRIQLPRRPNGTTLELEAGWFEPTVLPVQVEENAPESPGRRIAATEDLDDVFVFAEGSWRHLGPMKAGERRDPLAVEMLPENRLPGLPQYLQNHWNPRTPQRDWVVVARRRDASPRVAPVWTEAKTQARIIWVVQWP